jgi:uncharacterized OB-fold protein
MSVLEREPIAYAVCSQCSYPSWPILDMLTCGHANEPDIHELREAGQVYSWTRSWKSEGESAIIVMADFLEGSLRIIGPLGADCGEIAIGDKVTAWVGDNEQSVLLSRRWDCPSFG